MVTSDDQPADVNFWLSQEASKAWSLRVGLQGDLFQRTCIKSYLVASIAETLHGLKTNLLYPFILNAVLQHEFGLRSNADYSRDLDLAFFEDTINEFKSGDFHEKYASNETPNYASNIKLDLAGWTFLDIGCGEGVFTRFLSSLGAQCIGIDQSPWLLESAKEKAERLSTLSKNQYEEVNLESRTDFSKFLRRIEGRLHENRNVGVIAINVLDHIDRPDLLLKTLSESPAGDLIKCFACSTLDPDFFTELEAVSQNNDGTLDLINEQRIIQFPWVKLTNENKFYARSWASYDKIFTNAGFCVEDFSGTSPTLFSKLIDKQDVGAEWPLISGPFNLWQIKRKISGAPLNDDTLTRINTAQPFKELSSQYRSRLEQIREQLSYFQLPPGSHIASAGSPCDGLSVLAKGSVDIFAGDEIIQRIHAPSFFGDIESTGGFFSGRYLYSMKASKDSNVEFLTIPNNYFDDFFKLGTSLFDLLFLSMQSRFNNFTALHHRTFPPTVKRENRVKFVDDHFRLKTNHTNLEFLIRYIATALSASEEFVLIHNEQFTPVLPIQLRLLHNFHECVGIQPKEDGRPKSTPYKTEIALLDICGVVYAPSIGALISKSHPDHSQNLEVVREAFRRICGRMIELHVARFVKEKALGTVGDRLSEVISSSFWSSAIADFTGNYFEDPSKKVPARSANLVELELSKRARGIIERLSNELQRRFSDVAGIGDLANDILTEIAFVQRQIIAPEEPRFLVVRDYPFLREVTGGSKDWLKEITQRSKLYFTAINPEGDQFSGRVFSDTKQISSALKQVYNKRTRKEIEYYFWHLENFLSQQILLGRSLNLDPGGFLSYHQSNQS